VSITTLRVSDRPLSIDPSYILLLVLEPNFQAFLSPRFGGLFYKLYMHPESFVDLIVPFLFTSDYIWRSDVVKEKLTGPFLTVHEISCRKETI
jgi:hypothetical protein